MPQRRPFARHNQDMHVLAVDLLLVAAVVTLALLALSVLAVARLAWRLFRHNEQPIPGGSMGRQMFGRNRNRDGKQS